MITFTMHTAILRVLHDKLLEDGDVITITKDEIDAEVAKHLKWLDESTHAFHDINDTIIDALDILWRESFSNDGIKFAYEILMPIVMLHFNKSDVAKLEYFEELKLSLELYTRIIGNTGHSIDRETAKELYDRANKVLIHIKSGNC